MRSELQTSITITSPTAYHGSAAASPRHTPGTATRQGPRGCTCTDGKACAAPADVRSAMARTIPPTDPCRPRRARHRRERTAPPHVRSIHRTHGSHQSRISASNPRTSTRRSRPAGQACIATGNRNRDSEDKKRSPRRRSPHSRGGQVFASLLSWRMGSSSVHRQR